MGSGSLEEKNLLVEQYKLYVQSADNVSSRRTSSIQYLVAVNAALLSAYGIYFSISGHLLWAVLIAASGIAVSLFSCAIIRQHTNLNEVKFMVIHEMERHLPSKPYMREWELAESGQGRIYRPISKIEMYVPVAFFALHTLVLISIIAFLCVGMPSWATVSSVPDHGSPPSSPGCDAVGSAPYPNRIGLTARSERSATHARAIRTSPAGTRKCGAARPSRRAAPD